MALTPEAIQQISQLMAVQNEQLLSGQNNMLAKQSAAAVDLREMRVSHGETMGRIDGLVGKIEELESDMKAMRQIMIEQNSKFEERLKMLEAKPASREGEPSSKRARSAGPTVGRNDKHERTVEVGGFTYNSLRKDVVAKVNAIVAGHDGVEEAYGKFVKCSSACVRFEDEESMWDFLASVRERPKNPLDGERIWAGKLEGQDERKRNGAMRKCKYALIKGSLASAEEVTIAWKEGIVYVKDEIEVARWMPNEQLQLHTDDIEKLGDAHEFNRIFREKRA